MVDTIQSICVTSRNATYRGSFRAPRFVRRLYRKMGTWRAVACLLGYSPAYWCSVAAGRRRISRDAENVIRRLLGLPPKYFRRIDRMSPEDLAWYLSQRRPL
jgi:hypothetical protein